MRQFLPPDYNSLLDVFTQNQELRSSLREDFNACLISLGVKKLDIFSMNRSVLRCINSNSFSKYLKKYYYQEFCYSVECRILLFARVSIHHDDDVFSFYFYPNGEILNDFKEEQLFHVGLDIDGLSNYYSTTELTKFLKKMPQ